MPAVPQRVPKANLWILSSWRDLILYVGTPLLLIPLFALAQARWSAQDIYVFVAAFGATGHHLPGMIRAYGDRSVFDRFRWRFIFAPVFLIAVCTAFTWWDLKGIILVVFFWGVWHGMMQTYGFCRIYDAKVGSFAALTRRLDFATCALWFAAAVLLSTPRMTDTLQAYYASGAPAVPRWVLQAAQRTLLYTAIAVTILLLANFARQWAQGKRPNPVKLALLGTSIAFWWFCNNGVTNILAGIALFEVFHDVQYLSLVWIYNRNRVEKDSSIGGFMRFMFRRSGSLIGLYVGLVFAYGMLGYFKERVDVETIKRVLTGVVAASGLLHFYYDGFIWKVREKSTRESLGLTGGTAAAGSASIVPSWALHGLKWVAVFVIPLAALWVGQSRGPAPEEVRQGWLVQNFPSSASNRFYHAASLAREGRFDAAADEYRAGLDLSPNDAQAHYDFGHLLLTQGKDDAAATEFEAALRIAPRNADYHADNAYRLERLGQRDAAVAEYQNALRLDPASALANYDYAMFLSREGKFDEAIPRFEAALKTKRYYSDAHFDLGNALYEKNDLENAKAHYLEANRLSPNRAKILNMLGLVYARQGAMDDAIANFSAALRVEPNDPYAAENLRLAQEEQSRSRGTASSQR